MKHLRNPLTDRMWCTGMSAIYLRLLDRGWVPIPASECEVCR